MILSQSLFQNLLTLVNLVSDLFLCSYFYWFCRGACRIYEVVIAPTFFAAISSSLMWENLRVPILLPYHLDTTTTTFWRLYPQRVLARVWYHFWICTHIHFGSHKTLSIRAWYRWALLWPAWMIKVAHHTSIKFLKSRRKSLMMKNKLTYDRYECTKNKWKIFFFLVKI